MFPGVYHSKALPAPQQKLADQLISYWSRFAHTGDPNGPATPHWPRFTGTSVLSLAPGKINQTGFAAAHQCGFWDTFEH